GAAELRAFGAPDADAITQRAPVRLHQEEPPLRHVDDDAARLFLAVPGDLLTHQAGIDGGDVDRGNDEAAVADAVVAAGHATGGEQRQADNDRAPGQRVSGSGFCGGQDWAGTLTHGLTVSTVIEASSRRLATTQ